MAPRRQSQFILQAQVDDTTWTDLSPHASRETAWSWAKANPEATDGATLRVVADLGERMVARVENIERVRLVNAKEK